MNEFALIDHIVAALGPVAAAHDVRVGPGDDACVMRVPDGHELVVSMDSLLADRHFPAAAPGVDVGYRAIMVAVSDLAAMAATPRWVVVALSLQEDQAPWALELARGMREAAEVCNVAIVGGNLARGPASISLCVHGTAPVGQSLLRSGAKAGDGVYVTGPLGGAAAALRLGFADAALNRCYYRPQARVDLVADLRRHASAAIDLSDGLLQDLGHLAAASGVGVALHAAQVPLVQGASLEDALRGGDDYQICFTAAAPPSFQAHRIGEVTVGGGVTLDGATVATDGYQHFA